MKRALLLMGFAATALLLAIEPTVYAQDAAMPGMVYGDDGTPSYPTYSKTIPLHGPTAEKSRKAISSGAVVTSGTGLPTWTYTVTSPIDNNTYSGTMVGASPYFNGARTTNIPSVIVPVIVKMPDGSSFDPTINDGCSTWGTPVAQVLASPIFQTAPLIMNGINMGTGQFVDEFQRANFYQGNISATGNSYHTVLGPVTTLPAQTVTIPSGEGKSMFLGGCALVGLMDMGTFDSIISKTVIPSLTAQGLINSGTFPLFVLHDVVMGTPGDSLTSHCCTLSYHSALQSPTGAPAQTYAVADFDTSNTFQNPDIQPTVHAVADWMDDPYVSNTTPSWGHAGQVPNSCENLLEPGDPLNGVPVTLYQQSGRYGVMMSNGHTYFPQDLAFFSWFYRQSPSIAAAGAFTAGGTYVQGAGNVCLQ